MLMVGTIQNLQTTDNTVVYNFTSLNERYPRLLHLIPPMSLGARSDYEFDMNYAMYLLSNEPAFFDMMQIVYTMYMGKDVFLLIDGDDRLEMLNESLLKFIQQRYGISAVYITCLDDLLNANDVGFSGIGKLNIQQDKERLAIMVEKIRLQSGGQVV